jgi:hypothetical protein
MVVGRARSVDYPLRISLAALGATAICLAAAASAVALITPGRCHDTGPGIQQGVMWASLGLGFVLWLVGTGTVADAQAPIRTKFAVAALAIIQVGAAVAIFVFYGHQTAHYFDCG